jgi:hypothetical protein
MSEVKENNYEVLILAREYNLLPHGKFSKTLVIAPSVRRNLDEILLEGCKTVFVKATRISGKVVLELTPKKTV